MDPPSLEYTVNHVFMPLRLPQGSDLPEGDFSKEYELANAFYGAAMEYLELIQQQDSISLSKWTPVVKMLRNIVELNRPEPFITEDLATCLDDLKDGDILALLIRQQNAGVILRIDTDKVIAEAFRVSIPNADVLACQGKIVRQFPEACVSFASKYLQQQEFAMQLASVFSQLNMDEMDESLSHSIKAGSIVRELRDSPSPHLIMDWLFNVLTVIDGNVATPSVISKRIADDVLWDDALLPWRRSQLWLLARVAVQSSIDTKEYKSFMLYFMTSILQQASSTDINHEILSMMRIKIGRRSIKLQESRGLKPFLLDFVTSVQRQAEETIISSCQAHRGKIENNRLPIPWSPSTLNFHRDTNLHLKNSMPYISLVLSRSQQDRLRRTHAPLHPLRLGGKKMLHDLLVGVCERKIFKVVDEDSLFDLATFEGCVRDDIHSWTSHNLSVANAPKLLSQVIARYHSFASPIYAGNPESNSLMILTIILLWISLDKIILSQIPLLREFSSELSPKFLEPLLLRKQKDIQCAIVAARYLHRRYRYDSVFGPLSSQSFSVRYFSECQPMQQLKQAVEQVANTTATRRRSQATTKNQEFSELKASARQTAHVHHREYRNSQLVEDKRGCPSCKLHGQAHGLRVQIYEWPLPNQALAAKNFIFECLLPAPFAQWRATTFSILRDMFTSNTMKSPSSPLEAYSFLSSYAQTNHIPFRSNGSSRLALASTTKSTGSQAHYQKPIRCPITVNNIVVNHGLTWSLHDKQRNEYISSEQLQMADPSFLCRIHLPNHSVYSGLEFSLPNTSHTVNEVLSKQSHCSPNLSLHEFTAFGSLRSGGHLQWANIAKVISSRSLSFNRTPVYLLLSEATQQIGVIDSKGEILYHSLLATPSFCERLIGEMEDLQRTIAHNWQEVNSLKCLIELTLRLLASFKRPIQWTGIHSRTIQFLRTCRKSLYSWLCNRLHQAERRDSHRQQGQTTNLRDIALACRQTFDVDHDIIPWVLVSAKDVSIFLHCLIVLHNNQTPPDSPDYSLLDLIGDSRERRLACRLEDHVRTLILQDSTGLDEAIQGVLPDFRSLNEEWHSFATPNERWLVTSSHGSGDQKSQQVKINLLDGELLVDGIALGVLPDAILSNSTYQEVFGNNVLHVVPSNLLGLDYKSRHPMYGFYVYFRLASESRLIIQTLPEDSGSTTDLLEYLPKGTFQGDLPIHLVEEHCHWLHLSAKQIEFRPLATCWTQDNHNWHILLRENRVVMELHLGYNKKDILIDPASRTFKMMYQRVQPLDDRDSVIVIYHLRPPIDSSPPNQSISVSLPRFHLKFVLSKQYESLQSQDFPNTFIDLNQNIGTLHGLQNKLVLRSRVSNAASASSCRTRRVIIPSGDVKRSHSDSHTTTQIVVNHNEKVLSYHHYYIDTDLGCLVSADNSLEARLYKIYLHAVTSQVVPDILTSQSGLEEALSELYSAACMSFQRLKPSELHLLSKIRHLTPSRTHYPRHLKVMQTIRWNDLPSFIQSYHFEQRVQDILTYNHHLSIFDTKDNAQSSKDSPSYPGSSDLLSRSVARESLAYPIAIVSRASQKTTGQHLSHDELWSPPPSSFQFPNTQQSFLAGARMTWEMNPMVFKHARSDLYDFFIDMLTYGASPPNSICTDELDAISFRRDWFTLSDDDLRASWFDIFSACCSPSNDDDKRFRLLFSFSAWLYKEKVPAKSFVPQFLVVARDGLHYRDLVVLVQELSSWSGLDSTPSAPHVSQIVEQHLVRIDVEGTGSATSRRNLSNAVLAQWNEYPQNPLELPTDITSNCPALQAELSTLFKNCHSTSEFHRLVNEMSSALHLPTLAQIPPQSTRSELSIPLFGVKPFQSNPNFLSLFQNVEPPNLSSISIPKEATDATIPIRGKCPESTRTDLLSILSKLSKGNTALHDEYADDMRRSLAILDQSFEKHVTQTDISGPTADSAYDFIKGHLLQFETLLSQISDSLSPRNPSDHILRGCGQWPQIHLRNILQMMTKPFWGMISPKWQLVLVELCFRMIMVQYARRIYVLVKRELADVLADELRSPPSIHLTAALSHPDWLLIQIESDFCARPVQLRVAMEMYQPSSGHNLALQLNMGEGKTSVIVPFVASSLADGEKLVRVMVLKPLAQQMFHLLASRLCGLPNKRLAYLPFSRHMLHQSGQDLHSLSALYQSCIEDGTVIVAQPEHVLSAKLLSVEKVLFSDDNCNIGENQPSVEALRLYQHLRSSARDILDENDELLHPKYQLIYTLGNQSPVEGHPYRWTTLQHLLSLLVTFLRNVPPTSSIVLRSREDWIFPHLDSNSALPSFCSELAEIIVLHLVADQVPTLNVRHLSPAERKSISRFIHEQHPPQEVITLVRCQNQDLRCNLLLLRGYITTGLLGYGLRERRWRVDFGLDLSRSAMAVPFRSKDVPSPRAEFGHPDLAILLTCLAYYYQGLTEEQLRHCFTRLMTLSAPAEQYNEWISDIPQSRLAASLRHISGINLDDLDQFTMEILPLFQHNFNLINFYLGEFVFPKFAKSFPDKLPTSGWDLAEHRPNHTTGFSGTKDNHYLLPLSIRQDDPVSQAGTNAMVLMYMLQPENNFYLPMAHGSTGGKGIIDLVVQQQKNTHVLLDIGAQVLDMSNRDFAKYWLDTGMKKVEAAIFFDENDELMVIRRDGTVESFQSSTYNQQTGKCVVYLDDAHTRGTDLKFPRGWRAAVTLGKKVTKDRLIQGCMRMRQLGAGQALMFFAPPDVDFAIRKVANKPNPNHNIEIQDIVLWSMVETCKDVEHYAPAWAQQGADYIKRHEALDSFSIEDLQRKKHSSLRKAWLQKETKSLEEMYHPSMAQVSHMITNSHIRERLSLIGVVDNALSRDLNEEQEREVAHEVEAEPETERPQEVHPAKHSLHPELKMLVDTGVFKSQSLAFRSIEWYLNRHFGRSWKSLESLANKDLFSNRLLLTQDFLQTLQSSSKFPRDFMKPVQWVISWTRDNSGKAPRSLLLLISQYEANVLLPQIQKSKFVELHCYIARVTPTMSRFQGLQFFSTPSRTDTSFNPTLLTQLDIFAGQLYPCNYEDYERVCEFLGVDVAGNLTAQSDGFVLPEHRHGRLVSCPFANSPMGFFREFFSLRRKGQTFDKSPIGKLLEGRVLQPKDFA